MENKKPNYEDCNGCVFYLPKNAPYGGRFPSAIKSKPRSEDFCYKFLRNEDCGCANGQPKVSAEEYTNEFVNKLRGTNSK